jgi:hypothetical protein
MVMFGSEMADGMVTACGISFILCVTSGGGASSCSRRHILLGP